MILFGEGAVRKATAEFMAHYHSERHHQGLDIDLICPDPGHTVAEGEVHRPTSRRSAELLPQGCLRITPISTGRTHGVPCTVTFELATIQPVLLVDYQRGIDRQPEQGSIPLSLGLNGPVTLRPPRTERSIFRTLRGTRHRPVRFSGPVRDNVGIEPAQRT